MGQHTVVVPNAALIAICGAVQSQYNRCHAVLRSPGKAGHRAIRHGNGIEDSVVAALKICSQHGINLAIQAVICAGFNVCIYPTVGDNLPDQHLRCGVLHLTAVAIVHLWVAKRQNLLDVDALDAALPPQAQRDNAITAASVDAKILFFMRVLPPDSLCALRWGCGEMTRSGDKARSYCNF